MPATLEDYPPLVLATLGGFLQQLFGARRLLQAAAFPAVLTWIVIIAGPNSIACILASRCILCCFFLKPMVDIYVDHSP